jgi:hypothetical protein
LGGRALALRPPTPPLTTTNHFAGMHRYRHSHLPPCRGFFLPRRRHRRRYCRCLAAAISLLPRRRRRRTATVTASSPLSPPPTVAATIAAVASLPYFSFSYYFS